MASHILGYVGAISESDSNEVFSGLYGSISINTTTGAISATRANVNDLVLTGYTGTERSGDRITDTDTIGKAFKSVEYNLDII